MKHLILSAVVVACSAVSVVHAQTSTSSQSLTSGSSSSNSGSNNAVNTSTSSANPSAAAQAYNQVGGGSGGAGGTGIGGSAGATGGNVTANIAPTTTIQFVTPPTARTEQATTSSMTSDSTARIEQTTSGTTEQILSGTRTENINYSGTTTVKNVPQVNAPPLVSSNDTCMGSWSAGVGVAGLGLSGGNTYTDEHCKRIKMSRELWNKGMKAASLAMDCMDKEAREALEITGFVCPQTTQAQKRADAAAAVATAAVVAPAPPKPPVAAPAAPVVAETPKDPTAEAPVTAKLGASPYRPGYENVDHDDPYINR